MYVVYRISIAPKLNKPLSGRVYGRDKVAEFPTLDEANEKLQELNKRDQIHYYTIIMEP